MSISSEIGLDTDARRLALEVIATLVNVKTIAADQLLRRAGVTDDLARRFVGERDPVTNQKRSKREAGMIVLDALGETGEDGQVGLDPEDHRDCVAVGRLPLGARRISSASGGPEGP